MAGHNTLRLADVDQQLQKTTRDTVNWQAQLRAAMANSITAEDVAAIVKAQVEKAKAGNESSAKFILGHVLGANTPVRIEQTNIVTDVETAARIARGSKAS